MDERRLTSMPGKNGKRLARKGLDGPGGPLAPERVGFIIRKIESLSFKADFDIETLQGKVIMNVSLFPSPHMNTARKLLARVFRSRYVMSTSIAIAREGESIGGIPVPKDMIGVGTICSVTINSIFLKRGIPIISRYGGVMEVDRDGPSRFTQVLSYDGCSMDPLPVLIRSGMTSVLNTVKEGTGKVLASFKEIPVVCIDRAVDIQQRLFDIGISGLIMVGKPNQPLLEIPVSQDRVGLASLGGLNSIAALYEHGIETQSHAMSALMDYNELEPFETALARLKN
jgi:repressor of nif and glnA expression